MDVRFLIETYLAEAANLDKADVGVELELAVRYDLVSREVFPKFEEFLVKHGFDYTIDASVSVSYGKENFYTPIELSSAVSRWSELRQNLARVLAFLRHEDVVEVTPSFKLRSLTPVFGERPKEPLGGKLLRLPRAVIPQNFSAGTHLHFDHQWFDNYKHVRNFVATFNSFQRKLPDLLPKQRYHFDHRQNRHAEIVRHPLPQNTPMFRGSDMEHLSALIGLGMLQASRRAALNFKPVEGRGDIEFRFMHATLSLNVIEGWIRTIAELIELAKSEKGYWSGNKRGVSFNQYFQQNNPELADFLAKQRQKSATSRKPNKTDLPKATMKLQAMADKLLMRPHDDFLRMRDRE